MIKEQVQQELKELKSIEALKKCKIQAEDPKRLREKYDKLLSKLNEFEALILVKHIYYSEPYYKIGMDLNYSEEGIRKKYNKIIDKLTDLIDNAPTEDVVPRSEVEKAKQEVAREIFEEFEKCFDKRFGDWMFIHWKYAELKKKYIGE